MSQNSQVNYFDIRKTFDCFHSALIEDDDINLGYYLDAYKEISRLCDLLGSIFSFSATEIHNKTEALHGLRKDCQESHFETLKNMVEYEKIGNQFVGCNHLLMLHRGLDFIRTFLRRISGLNLEDSTHDVAIDAYSDTLGQFHPWWIRNAAYLALMILPNKRKLVVKVCGGQFDVVRDFLLPMLDAADKVYERTEELFKTHDLLDLS